VDVAAEPEVIQPVVSELATAEAPIVEPEALPDLPGLSDEAEDAAVELPTQTAPAVAEAAPVLELATQPVDEPETELEPPAEPEPASEPEPLADTEPAPEPEPLAAETEPVLSAFDEPELEATPPREAELEPRPSSADVMAEAPALETLPEPEPQTPLPVAEPEPERAIASTAMTQPGLQTAGAATPDVSSTLVAWPSGSPVAAPGNGAPAEAGSFEEATSVIPVWQQTDPNADPKGTVSLQAMPPEQVASGTGFAALLSFESGPFAGRIVALPNQMVSIG